MSAAFSAPSAGGLQALLKQVEAAKKSGFDDVKRAFAARAIKEVAAGFSERRDPYGAPWAGLKKRSSHSTGKLAGSFTAAVTASGFTIRSNADYADEQQFGAATRPKTSRRGRGKKGRIPARPMVPVGKLGPIWSAAFDDEAKRVMKKLGF